MSENNSTSIVSELISDSIDTDLIDSSSISEISNLANKNLNSFKSNLSNLFSNKNFKWVVCSLLFLLLIYFYVNKKLKKAKTNTDENFETDENKELSEAEKYSVLIDKEGKPQMLNSETLNNNININDHIENLKRELESRDISFNNANNQIGNLNDNIQNKSMEIGRLNNIISDLQNKNNNMNNQINELNEEKERNIRSNNNTNKNNEIENSNSNSNSNDLVNQILEDDDSDDSEVEDNNINGQDLTQVEINDINNQLKMFNQ
jgi:hypothetical protein